MVNSLERFRATFTPNGKRITFTKKENKQFHASFIPKNNITVLDSFYLLTLYFEKILNWIWRLPFAVKKKKKIGPRASLSYGQHQDQAVSWGQN